MTPSSGTYGAFAGSRLSILLRIVSQRMVIVQASFSFVVSTGLVVVVDGFVVVGLAVVGLVVVVALGLVVLSLFVSDVVSVTVVDSVM